MRYRTGMDCIWTWRIFLLWWNVRRKNDADLKWCAFLKKSLKETIRSAMAAGDIHRKLVHWSCFERTISSGFLMHGTDWQDQPLPIKRPVRWLVFGLISPAGAGLLWEKNIVSWLISSGWNQQANRLIDIIVVPNFHVTSGTTALYWCSVWVYQIV